MSDKVVDFNSFVALQTASEAAATRADTAATAAEGAAATANALGSTLIPQAALEPGGLQSLINRAGRGARIGLSGVTTLPLNGQLIITEDVHLIGTQGGRYFDAAQDGTTGAGGSILRGAPGLPQLAQIRGRGQYIPEYAITVDVGAFGAQFLELEGGYDFSGAGNHTGAVDGLTFTATTGPMRPILIEQLTARGFDAALRLVPRIIGLQPDGNGDTATYQTALANMKIIDSVLTGNRYSLYAEGWSSIYDFLMLNTNIERGGAVWFGDKVAAGRVRFEQVLAELNHNVFRVGCGQHGASVEFEGVIFEANTGYLYKTLGDPTWRSKLTVKASALNFAEATEPYLEATQIPAYIDEPTMRARLDRVQLLPDCRYKYIEGLREMSAVWTYVLSPAAELLGQPDRNEYLGANGVFGSQATNIAMTPLGRVGTYADNTKIESWGLGAVPEGGLVKFSMLVRSRTGEPVMTGLLVADAGGGYVPVNEDLRIRVLPEWHVLTIIVRAGQAFGSGQFKLTSNDVEYSSIHVGVQGSDKFFRPYYPTSAFS